MKRLTDEELVQALVELFDDIPPPETPEEVDAILREEGYDPDEIAAYFRNVADKALALRRMGIENGWIKEA